MSVKLIFRFPERKFKSIENVFEVLLPYLPCSKVTLTYPSSGILNRVKNWRLLGPMKKTLVHVTGFDHYLLLFRGSQNVILTIHDIEALKRKKGIRRFIFRKLWFDIPIRKAKAITTISKFTKDELLNLKLYKTPIHIIHNPNIFEIEKLNFNQAKSNPTVLLIGTKENKNLISIITALATVRCELNIVGDLTTSQLKLLESKNLIFKNYVDISQQELKTLYSEVSLLCFASKYEGFGLPIIEAQSLGCPVVTSNSSSMPEIAGKGAYFVNPFSEESIRDGVLKVLEDNNLREEMIAKGFENAKRFKPEYIAQQYSNLYNEIQNGTN